MTIAEKPAATLRLRTDANALASNWRALDRMSGSARAGAAVKADCYGLGVDIGVPALRDAGCEQFFVAHWSEVADVAQHVPAGQISVLHGPLSPQDARYAIASGAVPVINSVHQARVWNAAAGGTCDLMVDTGINRLGISPSDAADAAIAALDIRVLMSHLSSADEDCARNAAQLAKFRSVLPHVGHKQASLANSAGIALGTEYAFDLTRPGISLYGGVPRSELAERIQQVAFPQAAILQVRDIAAGDAVGYNAKFTAREDMRTATVSLGYADGLLRCWGANGYLTHGEAKLPILGRVSMDMIVVDIAASPDLREGDWLDLPYNLPDGAQQTALSQYELLTVLGDRFQRND